MFLVAFLSLSGATSAPRSIHSYDEKEGRAFFQGPSTRTGNFCIYLTSSFRKLLYTSIASIDCKYRSIWLEVPYSSSYNRKLPGIDRKSLSKRSYATCKIERDETLYFRLFYNLRYLMHLKQKKILINFTLTKIKYFLTCDIEIMRYTSCF